MTEASNQPTDGPAFTDLPPAEQYELLAADRRQMVLDLLAGQTTSSTLEELAAGVAAREDGTDADDEQAVQRVAISLHHCHLPKLAESGLLDYDPETRQIDPKGTVQLPGSDQAMDWLAVFSDPLRFLVLENLTARERTTLEELAGDLADANDPAVDSHPRTISIELHHNQLPRLDELGFVDYDHVDRVVEPTERLTREGLYVGTS